MNDKQTTTKGFAVLSAAGVVNKILALIYLPIQSYIVGYYGNGIISTGYTFYLFIFTLANAGIPVAISKLISEQNAVGNYKNSQRIFAIATRMLIGSGILFGIFMAVGARWISEQINQPQAYLMLLAFSPTILFTSFAAAFRGYFQGRLNMIPTAISQIIEQSLNTVLTIVFVSLFIKYGIEIAAVGSTLGTTIGALGSAGFLCSFYFVNRKKGLYKTTNREDTVLSDKEIIRQIIKFCLPIILGIVAMNLNNLIDLKLTVMRLLAGGISQKDATELYGILTNQFQKILNVPMALIMPLSAALIPAISEADKLKDKNVFNRKISESYRLVLLITLPSALGLAVLAKPIITVIFLNLNRGSDLMIIGSLTLILYAVNVVQNAILTGIGKPMIPTITMIIGMLLKIIANYILIAIPSINVKGAVVGTILGYVLACILNQFEIRKYTNTRVAYKKLSLKPILASLIMGGAIFLIFTALNDLIGKLLKNAILVNDISVVITIGAGIAIYSATLIFIKAISAEDIIKLPFGTKIEKLLSRTGIFKNRLARTK